MIQLLNTSIELIEYDITLSSGEPILISELDRSRIEDFSSEFENLLNPLLSRCVKLNRKHIEEMKLGYDKEFRKNFKTPIYCLSQIGKNLCRYKTDYKKRQINCSSYDENTCSTLNIDLRKKKSSIPICFEYDSKQILVSMIGTAIIHAWSEGRVVLFVID